MIIEIVSSALMGGLLGGTYLYQAGGGGNDQRKIEKIAANCGLVVKEDGETKSIRIHRKSSGDGYTEYAYQIPLGLAFSDFEKKRLHFQDGLNIKRSLIDVSLADVKALNWRAKPKEIFEQVRRLIDKRKRLRKEVELSYDGMLKIRVYNEALTEYVELDEAMLARCKGWQVPLGVGRTGFRTHDFELGHAIVAGATRYGKSVFLKNAITSLITRRPDHTRLTLIDLKGGLTFARYSGARQVESIAKDIPETLDALYRTLDEMTVKQADYLAKGFEDVGEARDPVRHFIVIDEAAQIASAGVTDKDEKKMRIECERILAKIAQVGAGLGYRLIFCTQYPTADTLPRQIKQNADTRICFRLQTAIASCVVLDEEGAEKLPKVRGRAIYSTPDGKEVVQTPFIKNEFIKETIAPFVTIRPRRDPDESGDLPGDENGEHTLIIKDA